jgi:hypothetical protein
LVQRPNAREDPLPHCRLYILRRNTDVGTERLHWLTQSVQLASAADRTHPNVSRNQDVRPEIQARQPTQDGGTDQGASSTPDARSTLHVIASFYLVRATAVGCVNVPAEAALSQGCAARIKSNRSSGFLNTCAKFGPGRPNGIALTKTARHRGRAFGSAGPSELPNWRNGAYREFIGEGV